MHISQVSEERVDRIKNVLKAGQDVAARVIKIDRGERRIGLSIKAASYTEEQLKEEQNSSMRSNPVKTSWRCNTPSMPPTKQNRNQRNNQRRKIQPAGGPATARLFLFGRCATTARAAELFCASENSPYRKPVTDAGNAES